MARTHLRVSRDSEEKLERSTERRTTWKFLMGDDGLWFWRATHPDGTELSSESTFATLRECTGDAMEQGYRALTVMENHVRTYPFFAADHYTVADIALYAYTHIAHEVGFDLTGFPAVRAWLKRVAEQPGHVAMDWQPARMAIAG